MDKATAANKINTALEAMESVIGECVFDEWAIVVMYGGKLKLFEYSGNRREDFISEFKEDFASMKDTLNPATAKLGDYGFSHEGYGAGFDAYMCVGPQAYLLLNNTEKSTGDIVQNPKWKAAQIHFATLLEAFLSDPL